MLQLRIMTNSLHIKYIISSELNSTQSCTRPKIHLDLMWATNQVSHSQYTFLIMQQQWKTSQWPHQMLKVAHTLLSYIYTLRTVKLGKAWIEQILFFKVQQTKTANIAIIKAETALWSYNSIPNSNKLTASWSQQKIKNWY